ncbi:MAG: hypothetical protein RL199_384 [Pseudomonadota bacterium]|jgi:uncharacterized membrane protein YfcA
MTAAELATVFAAFLIGGVVNAIAGGGMLIAFPVLLGLGMPSLAANATSTVGLLPASFVAAVRMRTALVPIAPRVPPLVAASLVGGGLGGWLLAGTAQHTFDRLVPWLVLGATALFALSSRQPSATRTRPLPVWSTPALQVLVAVYGGYFGGGQGVLILAVLAASHIGDVRQANALKNLCAGAANLVAAALFLAKGLVAPGVAGVAMTGSVAGGWAGAYIGRRLDAARLRWLIIAAGALMFLRLLLTAP